MYRIYYNACFLQIEAGKEKIKNMENEQLKLEEDKRKLNNQVEDLNTKVKGLENSIEQKNKHIKQLVSLLLIILFD